MSVTIILTCDICGNTGHDAKQPSQDCITSLRKRIENLESEKHFNKEYNYPSRHWRDVVL